MCLPAQVAEPRSPSQRNSAGLPADATLPSPPARVPAKSSPPKPRTDTEPKTAARLSQHPPAAPASPNHSPKFAGKETPRLLPTHRTTPRSACQNCAARSGAATSMQTVQSRFLPPDSSAFALPTSARSHEGSTRCSYALAILVQHLPQAIQFLGVDPVIFQDIQHQQLARILKKAAQQVTNFRLGRFLLIQQREIDMGPTVFLVTHVPLLLQNPDDGQHRVVSQRLFVGEGFQN